jgi:hypothetical protein
MAEINDGGQAFPFVGWPSPDGMVIDNRQYGMTLRDWFAAGVVDEVQPFQHDVPAATASVALALDPQVGILPLDRMIAEMNNPRSVLHDVGSIAIARPSNVLERNGIDIEFPVNLLDLLRHVPIKPQQIETYQTLHARPFRAGHYRDRVTSQLRSAA